MGKPPIKGNKILPKVPAHANQHLEQPSILLSTKRKPQTSNGMEKNPNAFSKGFLLFMSEVEYSFYIAMGNFKTYSVH